MSDLIKISTFLALMAVGSLNLPKILKCFRDARLHLIQESKASNWPKALTLGGSK